MSSGEMSLTLMMEVDRVCDQFEAAWRASGRAKIEDYLDSRTDADKPLFLTSLLAVEIELRGKAGERPTRGEYLARFAGFSEAIEEAFRQAQETQEKLDLTPFSPQDPALDTKPASNPNEDSKVLPELDGQKTFLEGQDEGFEPTIAVERSNAAPHADDSSPAFTIDQINTGEWVSPSFGTVEGQGGSTQELWQIQGGRRPRARRIWKSLFGI